MQCETWEYRRYRGISRGGSFPDEVTATEVGGARSDPTKPDANPASPYAAEAWNRTRRVPASRRGRAAGISGCTIDREL
jgi:hypothetical protein